jgi:two-component system response regulator DesR
VIRVLLAEDQAMIRGAVATLLGLEGDMEVVAQVGQGDEALAAVQRGGVDVAVLDIEMPGMDGLTAAAGMASSAPDVAVLIVTTFGRPGYMRRAMESGARGFMRKDAPAADLAAAIRRVHAGERVVDPTLAAAALSDGASPLTAREHEVLSAARRDGTVAELAGRLHLSQGTVRNHLSAAIQKLGVRNRVEAIRVAEDKGWL